MYLTCDAPEPAAEPLRADALHHGAGLPMKGFNATAGQRGGDAAADRFTSFVPCSLSGSRSEILRPISSSSLSPSLASGRCTALSFTHLAMPRAGSRAAAGGLR